VRAHAQLRPSARKKQNSQTTNRKKVIWQENTQKKGHKKEATEG